VVRFALTQSGIANRCRLELPPAFVH
jgi:hypothetical protein